MGVALSVTQIRMVVAAAIMCTWMLARPQLRASADSQKNSHHHSQSPKARFHTASVDLSRSNWSPTRHEGPVELAIWWAGLNQ